MRYEPTAADAEARMLDIVRSAGLPEPDRVEHEDDEVLFFWEEQKLVVIVELDS